MNKHLQSYINEIAKDYNRPSQMAKTVAFTVAYWYGSKSR